MIHVHAKFDSRSYHIRHVSRHEHSLTVISIYRIMLYLETEFHEKGGGGAGMRMRRGTSMVL